MDDLILNQAIDNFEIKSYETSLDVKDFDTSFVKGLSFDSGFLSPYFADDREKINYGS